MARRRKDFPSDDGEDFIDSIGGSGSKALLGAVLGQAVRDLSRKENAKVLWPELKIDAAKWILGIGEGCGPGISINDVAEELGVSASGIAAAIGAEEKLEELIKAKAERRARKAEARRGKMGYGDEFGILVGSYYA